MEKKLKEVLSSNSAFIEENGNAGRSILQNRQKAAFTLAEVVITLIVVGVVSAITIPMMNNNVNDKKWNVARQKAQATIGEAFKLATVNGYVTSNYDNSKDFVTKVLTKYLKINKQCDTAQACGFSSSVKRADGKSQLAIPTTWENSTTTNVISGANGTSSIGRFSSVNNGIRTKFNDATYFQTLDGFSVALFYNPYCAVDEKDKYFSTETYNNIINYKHYSLDIACINAVYDMNGKKGPNRVGKDVGFLGSFYNGYRVKAIAVLPHGNYFEAKNSNLPGNGSNLWLRCQKYCRELHDNNWKVPDIEELSLIYLNKNIYYGQQTDYGFWTSVPFAGTSSYSYYINFHYQNTDGIQRSVIHSSAGGLLCVRNNN